jgi:hypothetical protein
LVKSQYKTCHSPNQRRNKTTQGWEGKKAHYGVLFCWLNIAMIAGINFSRPFPVKHDSPVGNDSGYYLAPNTKPVVPVIRQPVKL